MIIYKSRVICIVGTIREKTKNIRNAVNSINLYFYIK